MNFRINNYIIKNIRLYSKGIFKKSHTTTYEVHYEKENSQVADYYINDIFDHRMVTKRSASTKTTKCYGKDGMLFSEEIITYSNNMKPIWYECKIQNADGTVLKNSYALPQRDL